MSRHQDQHVLSWHVRLLSCLCPHLVHVLSVVSCPTSHVHDDVDDDHDDDNDDDDDDDENKNKEAKKNTLYRSLTCSRNECRDVFFTFFLCARWYISLFLFFFPKKLVALFPQWEKR